MHLTSSLPHKITSSQKGKNGKEEECDVARTFYRLDMHVHNHKLAILLFTNWENAKIPQVLQ